MKFYRYKTFMVAYLDIMNFRLEFRWGPPLFSERHGIILPLLRIPWGEHGFRIFGDRRARLPR